MTANSGNRRGRYLYAVLSGRGKHLVRWRWLTTCVRRATIRFVNCSASQPMRRAVACSMKRDTKFRRANSGVTLQTPGW